MNHNILKNKSALRIYKIILSSFNFLNKYLYILSIISLLSSLRSYLNQSKFYKFISWLIRIMIILNLFFGVGLIVYFTDFVSPVNITLSYYLDYLKPYIDMIKRLYNDLILKFNIEESIISNVKESKNIKDQIKGGIKEGVKEALDEMMIELEDEIKSKAQTDIYKGLALFGSMLFFGYFFLILPCLSLDLEVRQPARNIN